MSLVTHVDVIGHVCHDLLANGEYILGGPASYCSITASRFCDDVSLLTSHGDDFLFDQLFEDHGVTKVVTRSSDTTVFENIYHDNGRVQYMHSRAGDIDIRTHWLEETSYPDVIMLCPIADELLTDIKSIKSSSDVLITSPLQGWLRAFDKDGKVYAAMPNPENLAGLDIGILSEDDMEGLPHLRDLLINQIPLLVITSGIDGADIYTDDQVISLPAFPSQVVDLTGAGDVFSASFICAYSESRDIVRAGAFAHSAASLSIEAHGLSGLPQLDQILERQDYYMKHYL